MTEYYVCNHGNEHDGWMDGCMVWWRPDGHGYTYDLDQAGIYTDADKEKRYPDPRTRHYIPKELVDANTYSPRLAWWSRGRMDAKALCEVLALEAIAHPNRSRIQVHREVRALGGLAGTDNSVLS